MKIKYKSINSTNNLRILIVPETIKIRRFIYKNLYNIKDNILIKLSSPITNETIFRICGSGYNNDLIIYIGNFSAKVKKIIKSYQFSSKMRLELNMEKQNAVKFIDKCKAVRKPTAECDKCLEIYNKKHKLKTSTQS